MLLSVYVISLIVLILFGISAITIAAISSKQISDSYENAFRTTMIDAHSNGDNDTLELIDLVQQKFQCCGVTNSSDYTVNDLEIPESCSLESMEEDDVFETGCTEAFLHWFSIQINWTTSIFSTALVFQCYGIIAAILTIKNITKKSI